REVPIDQAVVPRPGHYRAGLVQDESALRSALGWGRTHARTAAQTLAAYYETTRRTGKHVQRVRVQTRWSRLALHAAKRMRSSLEPDPATVERILNGPPLTITLVMRGFHKGLVSKLDMVLVQGSHRVYAPTLERRDPRPIKEDGRIVAYEGELKGDFPPDALNPRKSATLEVRGENDSYFYVDSPLWRFK
ncbi:MAG: hypothetical protein ACE5IM_12415, partial [Nitrospinota bacterium]